MVVTAAGTVEQYTNDVKDAIRTKVQLLQEAHAACSEHSAK